MTASTSPTYEQWKQRAEAVESRLDRELVHKWRGNSALCGKSPGYMSSIQLTQTNADVICKPCLDLLLAAAEDRNREYGEAVRSHVLSAEPWIKQQHIPSLLRLIELNEAKPDGISARAQLAGIREQQGCLCDPPGSGEEFCVGTCLLKQRVAELESFWQRTVMLHEASMRDLAAAQTELAALRGALAPFADLLSFLDAGKELGEIEFDEHTSLFHISYAGASIGLYISELITARQALASAATEEGA